MTDTLRPSASRPPSRRPPAAPPRTGTAAPRAAPDAARAREGARGGDQLLLRERVDQRARRLVVVRALDQVLGVERLAQLAVQQRRLGSALGERLRGEQAEQARLADDVAGARYLPHADVVHPL